MWLRLILGIVYLGMALGQTLSATAMPGIIDAYDTVPEPLLIPFVVALIAAEAVAGAWLISRPRSTALAPVWLFTAVSVVWTLLAVQAFARSGGSQLRLLRALPDAATALVGAAGRRIAPGLCGHHGSLGHASTNEGACAAGRS